jgi:hypothetical protein
LRGAPSEARLRGLWLAPRVALPALLGRIHPYTMQRANRTSLINC